MFTITKKERLVRFVKWIRDCSCVCVLFFCIPFLFCDLKKVIAKIISSDIFINPILLITILLAGFCIGVLTLNDIEEAELKEKSNPKSKNKKKKKKQQQCKTHTNQNNTSTKKQQQKKMVQPKPEAQRQIIIIKEMPTEKVDRIFGTLNDPDLVQVEETDILQENAPSAEES